MNKWIYFVFALAIVSLSTNAQKSNNIAGDTIETLNRVEKSAIKKGTFITIKENDGTPCRAYSSGPENANVAILFVHDYFGISNATKESVERLGALGYRTIAVDLYKGKSATINDSAAALMQAKDSVETAHILRASIDYLKKPGRKLAAIGFSAGGIDAMNATLMEPELFTATIIVYAGSYDKIEKSRLDKLKSPVLAITGALDNWPVQAALNFFATEKNKSFEMYFYPGADHGYAQPLFNGGKNYDAEATRVTWMLMKDFLLRNLKSNSN
jgi:carboxymethylenebutenolidase